MDPTLPTWLRLYRTELKFVMTSPGLADACNCSERENYALLPIDGAAVGDDVPWSFSFFKQAMLRARFSPMLEEGGWVENASKKSEIALAGRREKNALLII